VDLCVCVCACVRLCVWAWRWRRCKEVWGGVRSEEEEEEEAQLLGFHPEEKG